MWRILVPTVAFVFGAALAQPAAAQSGADLVRQSVAAQGSAAALNSAKTTIIKGEAKHWEPGQSYSPTGEARFLGDSTYTQTVDNATRTARVDWDRDMKYPFIERLKYSEITTPTFGVLIDDKGAQRPMSGIRLAAHWRERERASPRLLVRALDAPDSISALPDQKIGDRSLPAVSIKTRAGTFTVLFDRTTHLPAAIRTRDADNVYGDSNYDMILSDWKDVGGTKRAHTLSFQLNGIEVQRLTLKEVTVNAPIPANTFAVSDEVKAKAKYPGKPIKQLVLTHHHMDHSSGTRTYVAEGAEIVMPSQARPFFEKMFQAEHKLAPDTLALQPKPAKIVDVKDTMSLKDETVTINLYNIPNPHSDGMIIGHVVGPNIVWVTDLISPRGPVNRSPGTVAVGDALRKAGITGATIAGGHGTTAKQADIAPALAAN